MASYPSQIASFPTHVNITEIIDASHPNNIQSEVVAVEATIGVDPTISTTPSPSGTFNGTSTTFASVVARLANIETGIVSDAHTQYLRKAGDAANIIIPVTSTVRGLVIQAASGQSVNLQEWKNSSGTVVTAINSTGNLIGTASGNVALSTVTTAGDLIVGSGSGTVARLGIGSASTMLTSNGSSLSWTSIATLQGTTGTQGVQGPTGTQGVQGLLGNQGVQGITGAVAAQGIQGTTGIQGSLGTQGATGPQGIQGTTGTQGTTGIQGNLGTQGTTGPQGVQGTIGTQGVTGTGYTGVTSTTSATPASSGSITLTTNTQGSFVTGNRVRAVNTVSNYFEGNVTITSGTTFAIASTFSVGTTLASNWTITLAGERGVQGTQGTTGTQGVQGLGFAQLQGIQGTTGLQGNIGSPGSTGAQGTAGLQGLQGFGFAQLQGPQGTAGLQGTTGTQGVQGTYAATYSIGTKTSNTNSTLADAAAVVFMNVASANTYTILSGTGFPAGTSLSIIQTGAGQTTINGSGVTIQSTASTPSAPRLRTRYSAASAVYDGTTWFVYGDIY
jgi:hypothetical protein